MLNVLDSNKELILNYKEDLSNRYRYVEINERDRQLKKLLEICVKIVHGDDPRLPKDGTFDHLGINDIDIVDEILNNHINLMNKGRYKANEDHVALTKDLLENLRSKLTPTSLSNAIESSDITFKSFSEIKDLNFLNVVKITKQAPISVLLEKFPSLRLTNQLIQ